jgi:hypothetical protein
MLILDDSCEELKNIHDNSFPFPDVSNPLYISKKLVISQGKLVGGGLVRLTAEGILILDQSLPVGLRAIASKAIITALKEDVKKKGLDECHVFVKDPNVQELLRRFGFVNCQGGQPMIIHF